MEKFKALKEQAQKMGVKLPASIGASKCSVNNVKSINAIKGLTQEIMLKNQQIEALIKTPAQTASVQLPQQASSLSPQIVEKSEPPSKKVDPNVTPKVNPNTGSVSDSDIDKALNDIPGKR